MRTGNSTLAMEIRIRKGWVGPGTEANTTTLRISTLKAFSTEIHSVLSSHTNRPKILLSLDRCQKFSMLPMAPNH